MQKFTMTAKCVAVGPIQEIGSNGFKKREIVLCEDESEKFPHFVAWELKKDRVNLVNESCVGQELTVSGYPESRAWDDPKTGKKRYFTSLSAISVQGAALCDVPEAADPGYDIGTDEVDDMPF